MITTLAPDELMNKYYDLKFQSEVPNLQEYAEQFAGLAAEFAAQDRPAMAENCQAMYRQYNQLSEYMPNMKRTELGGYTLLEQLK